MAGMEVIGQVEIDPQCRKVLAHHWPDVARYEDVREISGNPALGGGWRQTKQSRGTSADLICGGFPCQDLSVAGRRAGLDGARSGLWFEFQRIVSELRPRYVLVENVPGLLSSNEGRDFAVIIDGLGELGYGVSWTVLDAQHFGVAQRRRRVFIVAGPPDGRTEAILALAEGCAGHPEARRAAGKDATADTGSGVANAVQSSGPPGTRRDDDAGIVANPLGAKRGWRGDLDNDTYIPEVVGALDTALGHHGYATSAQSAAAGHFLAVRTAQTSANGHGIAEDVTHALDGASGQAIAIQERAVSEGSSGPDGRGWHEGTAYTLEARPKVQMAAHGASVRRLTPTECERLMGLPDGWTDVDGMADGPRYRMLGNAVVVPVIQWIGERIMAVEQ